jgi:L-cysteine/cystine lyase
MLPLEFVSDIDFFAFTGNKWVCGPAGLGGLYINPRAIRELRPTFVGWRSLLPTDGSKHSDARKFEVGTSAYALGAGFRAAVDLHNSYATPAERLRRITQLIESLLESIGQLNGYELNPVEGVNSGIITIRSKTNNAQQLERYLATNGIIVKRLTDDNKIRLCVHYFTLEEEIEFLTTTLRNFHDLQRQTEEN